MEYVDQIEKQTTLWTDIHKPVNIREIVGNAKGINEIINWLKSFDTNKKLVLGQRAKDLLNKGKSKGKPKLKKDNSVIKAIIAEEDEPEIENMGQTEDVPELTETVDAEGLDEDEDERDMNNRTSKQQSGGVYSCMIVTGEHGVGKTCGVFAILHELGYSAQTINFNRIQKNKNIKEVIDRLTTSNGDIFSLLHCEKPTKTAIIIDELESLTTRTESNCINALIENNELLWTHPIIFISNNQHNKFISGIKKRSYQVKFWQPFPNNMLTLLDRICSRENIKIQNPQLKETIINHAQFDMRRLVFILQDIKHTYADKNGTVSITPSNMKDYCELSKTKDKDFDLFTATKVMLNGYIGIDGCLRYHETEKVHLPLMIHQSYLINVNNFSETPDTQFMLASKISEVLSRGDVVENYIYGYQNWSIYDVQGFYTCVTPSYLMDKYLMDTGDLNKIEDVVFTTDLNKTSIKKINKKNITNVNKFLKNKDIHDYVYMNQIIRKLLEEGKTKQIVELIDGYDIKLSNIETLLKVDKIKSPKTNLTSKQKTEINRAINKYYPEKIAQEQLDKQLDHEFSILKGNIENGNKASVTTAESTVSNSKVTTKKSVLAPKVNNKKAKVKVTEDVNSEINKVLANITKSNTKQNKSVQKITTKKPEQSTPTVFKCKEIIIKRPKDKNKDVKIAKQNSVEEKPVFKCKEIIIKKRKS